MDEHPLSRCPIDGARLSSIEMGLRQPTVYTHRDGAWHHDLLAELHQPPRSEP